MPSNSCICLTLATMFLAACGANLPTISGDFDGDGIDDTAYLEAASSAPESLLTVCFGSPDLTQSCKALPEHSPDVPLDEIMIYAEPPGSYPTACYQMPEDCTAGIPEQVDMTTDGIVIAVLGEAAVLIYLDRKSEKFLRHLIID